MSEPQKTRTMTEDEIRELVESTVLRTFERLGLDAEDPIQVQRDFQFMRDWRLSSESVKAKALVAAVGILVAGAMGALFMGIVSMFNGGK